MTDDHMARVRAAEAALLEPGAPFELEAAEVHGRPARIYRHRPANVVELWRRAATIDPDRLAIVDERTQLTYAQLRADAARFGHAALGAGLTGGDRIGIAGANSCGWAVAWWGAISAGLVPVALNAWWTGAELADAIERTGCRLVVADDRRRHRLVAPEVPERPTSVIDVRDLADLAWAAEAAEAADADEADADEAPSTADETDVAAVFFTSGTAGAARAVPHTHLGLVLNHLNGRFRGAALMAAAGLDPDAARPPSRVLVSSPFFHLSGCHAGLVLNHLSANTIITSTATRAEALLDVIETHRPDVWTSVPALVWRVVDHPDVGRRDLSSLTRVGYGGAPSGPELHERIREVLPGAAVGLGSGYGLTETTAAVTSATGEEWLARPASVGRPLPTFEVATVDGEIVVRGAMVMSGYLDDPDATGAAIDADGWFHTGDIGHLDADGYLHVTDRAKDVIMRGGENIASAEVERRLQAHPAVADVAVVGVAHPHLGEEVAAYVVTAPGHGRDGAALAEWVGGALAGFKVPTIWRFVDGPLPRNAAGKLVKSRLR